MSSEENKVNSQFCDLAESLTSSGGPKGKSSLNKVNFLTNVKTKNQQIHKPYTRVHNILKLKKVDDTLEPLMTATNGLAYQQQIQTWKKLGSCSPGSRGTFLKVTQLRNI